MSGAGERWRIASKTKRGLMLHDEYDRPVIEALDGETAIRVVRAMNGFSSDVYRLEGALTAAEAAVEHLSKIEAAARALVESGELLDHHVGLANGYSCIACGAISSIYDDDGTMIQHAPDCLVTLVGVAG